MGKSALCQRVFQEPDNAATVAFALERGIDSHLTNLDCGRGAGKSDDASNQISVWIKYAEVYQLILVAQVFIKQIQPQRYA
jgi:hypothetical protein